MATPLLIPLIKDLYLGRLPVTYPSDPLSYKVVGTKRELKRGFASLI